MAKHGKNKRVLLFLDERGTIGKGDFFLGALVVPAVAAGRIDKVFSDLLEPSAREIHAKDLSDEYLFGLMERFWAKRPTNEMLLVNRRIPRIEASAPVAYAQAVVETVKMSLKLFRRNVMRADWMDNVHLILDHNDQNDHPDFDRCINQERTASSQFRAVENWVRLDSSVSRLLQLADVAAYARRWADGGWRADRLRDQFGIHIL